MKEEEKSEIDPTADIQGTPPEPNVTAATSNPVEITAKAGWINSADEPTREQTEVEALAAKLQASGNKVEQVTGEQWNALVNAGLINRSLRCLKSGKPLEVIVPPHE
jgi:hypothetical protein